MESKKATLRGVLLAFWIAVGSNALSIPPGRDEQSAMAYLLQAPPVVRAACFVKDVTVGTVIVNKICQCSDTTVECDVGPIVVGEVELTFCNKKPTQSVADLLLMRYACNISDPGCGPGTVCDIGPIEYENNVYYLCVEETSPLPPLGNADICQPAGNASFGPEGPSDTTTTPFPTPAETTTTKAPSQKTDAPEDRTTTSPPPRPVSTPSLFPTFPVAPSTTTRPQWRPWVPPTWGWPPVAPPANPPPPPVGGTGGLGWPWCVRGGRPWSAGYPWGQPAGGMWGRSRRWGGWGQPTTGWAQPGGQTWSRWTWRIHNGDDDDDDTSSSSSSSSSELMRRRSLPMRRRI